MKTTLFAALLLPFSLSLAAAPVPYERIPADTFASFVKNWDEARTPVLCAVIRDAAEWNAVFGAAAFMGNKRPFAPEPATWKQHQMLIVSQVMPAPAKGAIGEAFTVQSVEDDGGGVLTVRYACAPPPPNSYRIKNTLLLKIPRKDYTRVVFIEGEKAVGELGPGAWVRPAPAP